MKEQHIFMRIYTSFLLFRKDLKFLFFEETDGRARQDIAMLTHNLLLTIAHCVISKT